MKNDKILNVIIVILITALILIFVSDHGKRNEYKKQEETIDQNASANLIPTDENAINLSEAMDTETMAEDSVFLSYDRFLDGCTRTSHHVGETSVSYRFSRTVTSGGSNVYLLNFKMRAENEAAQIRVNFGVEHDYYVTTEWRDFYVPCTTGKIDSIKITLVSAFQKLYLSDLTVLSYDPLNIDYHHMKNGTYLSEGINMSYFAESEGIGVGETMDVTGDGEYLYSAGDETLKISRITPSGTELISSLTGLGNVRRIKACSEYYLAIASRENGVYLVNVADKKNPYVESRYDSLEMANDVCLSGNYMFVAGRYFGVEIVDISDIKNPVYITRIVNDKECFRCTVDKNYLFVSCWATGEVEIYDVSTLNKPVLVNTISVTGRCGEAFVDGNMIYIVSGHSDFTNANDVGDPGYGTGNGLAIYDISDIKRPVWHSTIKTEGMMYGNGYDDWSVKVSDGYAYFTNSFGGLYVYDIRDTKNLWAVMCVAVSIPASSNKYIDFTQVAKTVFPYDEKKEIYSPAMGVYVADGKVFFGCAYNDVYEFDFEKAMEIDRRSSNTQYTIAESANSFKLYDAEILLEEYDVYAIESYGDFYVAATAQGLLLLDKDLTLTNKCLTENPVKDVKVTKDGVFVTAEVDGVGIYVLEGIMLLRTGFVESQVDNHIVSSVGITGDGSFAVVQSSWTKYEFVDLRDINNPIILNEVISKNGKAVPASYAANSGNMYYRNIVSGTVDGAVGIGGSASMIWFESKDDKLQIKNSYPNFLGAEVNGNAVMENGKDVLTLYSNAVVTYDPMKATESTLRKLEKYYVPNVRLKGKLSIRDNLLVACNAPSGNIQLVNIEDATSPYLLDSYNIENSPGIAFIEDGFVLVPIRHGGIMKIEMR